MSPGSMAYTLVGFSPQLDWRPLRFVKPIPANRVCDACGVVRKWTALLPCRHILCESCYELSTQDSGCVCPLDAHQCEEEDVDLMEFPAEELLRREAKCWNEGSDCRAVLPASKIADHFHHDCRHHSIRCPRCSAAVLCSDVCAHLGSECSTAAIPAATEWEGDSSRKRETAPPTSLRQTLELQAGELKTLLERLLFTSGANSDRLNEISHGVNSCKEALREELRQGISSFRETVRQEVVQGTTQQGECMKKCSGEIIVFIEETKERLIANSESIKTISNSTLALERLLKDKFAKGARVKRDRGAQPAGGSVGATEQAEKTNNAQGRMSQAVSRSPHLQASVCEFVVKGIRSLQQKVLTTGHAFYETEPVYLRGCCMSPGVYMIDRLRVGYSSMYACFRLHKGDMDDVVDLPHLARIRIRFGGPEIVQRRCDFSSIFLGPQRGPVQEAFISSECDLLEGLIHDGCVQGDQLRITFEVLP